MSLARFVPTDPLSRLRLSVMLLMAAALAPAIIRLGCIHGLVRTIRIDGPSMAETVCGSHFRVTCGDCGITFRCDADDFPDDRRAVCPNCGFRENELREEDLRRGDRVLVDTWPYLWTAPRRGDMVMLIDPLPPDGAAGPFAVKRVIALARERPGVRSGDLLADGEAVRKSIKELREVSLLIHDNDFLPRSLPNHQRWTPLSQMASNWRETPDGFRFVPVKGLEKVQWLDYQHWHCSASPAPRTAPARVQDNDSYNQAENRGLNLIRDLLLRCHVKAPEGDVLITLRDPPHSITVHLKPGSKRFLVLKNDSPVAAHDIPKSAGEFQLEAALCDGRFLLAHNRHVLAAFQYDGMPVHGDRQISHAGESPLRIGAFGAVEVSHIQVWRDIYHLTPTRLSGDWRAETPLADDQFFLLGDNSPISIDSRHWPGGGVPRSSILGKVIPIAR